MEGPRARSETFGKAMGLEMAAGDPQSGEGNLLTGPSRCPRLYRDPADVMAGDGSQGRGRQSFKGQGQAFDEPGRSRVRLPFQGGQKAEGGVTERVAEVECLADSKPQGFQEPCSLPSGEGPAERE